MGVDARIVAEILGDSKSARIFNCGPLAPLPGCWGIFAFVTGGVVAGAPQPPATCCEPYRVRGRVTRLGSSAGRADHFPLAFTGPLRYVAAFREFLKA